MKHPRWKAQASCQSWPGEHWDGEMTTKMFRMCMSCPVRDDCLMEALGHEPVSDVGVWGGTDLEERVAIRKGADPYQVWDTTRSRIGML